MRKSLFALAALVTAAVPTYATTPIPPVTADFSFFGEVPKGEYLGEVLGVAVNSKGHVFAYSRNNTSGELYRTIAATLYEFDANGKFVQEVKNVYGMGFAHNVRVDRFDNVWITDKGTDNVVRFSPDLRKVTLVLGRKGESANPRSGPIEQTNPPRPAGGGEAFREVTDVSWDTNDNIYVSDGYVNSRVAKFDPDGNYLMSWGKPGHGGPGEMDTVHTIAVDKQNNVYVGDRANARIQVFDANGKFERFITTQGDVALPAVNHPIKPVPDLTRTTGAKTSFPGAPWVICISKPNASGEQFLFSADSYPGRIYKMKLDGTVLAAVGNIGHKLGEFGDVHGMACLDENTLIVGDELNWRMTKVKFHTDQRASR